MASPPPSPPPRKKVNPLVWTILAAAVLASAGSWMLSRSRAQKTAVMPAEGGQPRASAVPPSSPAAASPAVKIPDWVPIYPGTTPTDITSHPTPAELYIRFNIRANDDCIRVMDYYEQQLNRAGFVTFRRLDEPGSGGAGYCDSRMQSDGPGRTRSINVHAGHAATGSVIDIEVVERNTGVGPPGFGTANSGSTPSPKIPDWVPIYPGSTPSNFGGGTTFHGETRLSFSFPTREDYRKVISWYEDKLKAAGFNVTSDFIGERGGALWSHTQDNRRSLNIRTSRSGPETVIFLELRDS